MRWVHFKSTWTARRDPNGKPKERALRLLDFEHLCAGALCAGHGMQGAETACFYFASASLAHAIQPPVDSLESLVNGRQLIPRRIVDRLQGLVILQLNGPIARIADQRLIAPLQIAYDALVAQF